MGFVVGQKARDLLALTVQARDLLFHLVGFLFCGLRFGVALRW
jgi:hypothetical protein